MPSAENPYGVALYASCFWPYTFKHSGFRYFVKFCEKYGIPWALGRYPVGTPKEQQDELARALAAMIEDGVAAVQEGVGVELLEAKHSGQLAHERLIDVCNREMSKALTSQTLATENQTGGSQAAATIHRERETAVNESDRQIIVDTMNEFLSWITAINVPGAAAPTFEFYDEAQAREDWVGVLEKARRFVQVPRWFAHERLQIPQPTDEEIAQGDLLPGFGESAPAGPGGLNFSRGQGCACCGGEHEFAAGRDDQAAVDALGDALSGDLQPIAEKMFQPLLDALADGMTPEDLSMRIGEWYPKLDDAALEDLLARAILVADLHGRLAAQRDANDG
jgi:phage gp29-like protein